MHSPQRLLIYDRTCRGRRWAPGLTHSWIAGALIYRGLRRFDAYRGVRSWEEALAWLAARRHPIAEVQYWGHGKWGELYIAQDKLDNSSLQSDSPHYPALSTIREKMCGPQALWWFRTCESFGAKKGQQFARAWTDFFGCRSAGHTYVIGPLQSGLHSLAPGQTPHWSAAEGIFQGSPEEPVRAYASNFRAPNTIHCLQGHIPAGF